ncbi:TonB-dependent receptor plug domain-containing protein [Polaribacter sp.]|uniref:TonB-dependent receptor plug domain-containing protein n=1 Tax=Polaribacter sp. TaxID=1920175 RepID=UPI003F6CBFBF
MGKKIIILIGFLFLNISINAQSNKIVIKVKDEKNRSVAGATILLDNKKQNAVTNLNGVFKTTLKFTPKTISAFHPAIGIVKVKYEGEKKLVIMIRKGKNIALNNDSSNQISGETIQINSIYDYVRGRVSGVNVTSDNVITIRGYNSLQGNMTPLFILNGTQITQDVFGRIIPQEIKRITVLKGNDTAIYGIRGANGVIVVETK